MSPRDYPRCERCDRPARERVLTAMLYRGEDTPRPANEREAEEWLAALAAQVPAQEERLQEAIEVELASVSDPVGPFESGATAAYHWVLSRLGTADGDDPPDASHHLYPASVSPVMDSLPLREVEGEPCRFVDIPRPYCSVHGGWWVYGYCDRAPLRALGDESKEEAGRDCNHWSDEAVTVDGHRRCGACGVALGDESKEEGA